MDKIHDSKEHPEVQNMKNICDTSPKTPNTKVVCDKINKVKSQNKGDKSSPQESKTGNSTLDDSANPGNQYVPENREPKKMEKKGFNNFAKTVKIKK